MKSVELFAGCGGLALGLKRAGFDCVRAFELNGNAVNTMRAAGITDPANVVQADLAAISAEEWSSYGLGRVDLLAGGPPCQPFSVGGKGRGEWDKRDGFPHFLRAIEGLKPRSFLMENVKGLTSYKHKDYLDAIINSGRDLGYNIFVRVLNASHYGVPQTRERVFVVGTTGDFDFSWPERTHGTPMTVRDALGAPPGVSAWCSDGGRSKLPPHRPVHSLDEPCMTQRAQHGGGGSGVLMLGSSDLGDAERVIFEDGSTSAVKSGWSRPPVWFARRVKTVEAAKLQGFTEQYPFCGGVSETYKMIGNAVPPRMGEVMGRAIRDIL